jgi:hypothetical protein
MLAPLDSLALVDYSVGATVRFAGSVSRFALQALCGRVRTPDILEHDDSRQSARVFEGT